MSVEVLNAPAKLTHSLRVTGRRRDGLHLLDAEMVTLDFGDSLVLTSGDALRYEGVGPFPSPTHDLVAEALHAVDRVRDVTITKRIPPGAGLGGGSADAAAILRWGGWTDLRRASRLGADVPFCLVGGRARVRGIGEVVEPLPFVARTYTLSTPPFGCPTPAVYARWDELGGPHGDAGNDLEPAALDVEPRLAQWRDRLGDVSGLRPALAGSGSTWFVEGAFPGEERRVVHTTP